MRESYLLFGQPLIEEAEIEEVVKSMRAAWLGTGPKVAAFEKMVPLGGVTRRRRPKQAQGLPGHDNVIL